MIQLTKERIEEVKTPRGGFLDSTIRALGVEFIDGNPKRWKARVLNTWITGEQWAKALATVHPARVGPTLFDMPPGNSAATVQPSAKTQPFAVSAIRPHP